MPICSLNKIIPCNTNYIIDFINPPISNSHDIDQCLLRFLLLAISFFIGVSLLIYFSNNNNCNEITAIGLGAICTLFLVQYDRLLFMLS